MMMEERELDNEPRNDLPLKYPTWSISSICSVSSEPKLLKQITWRAA